MMMTKQFFGIMVTAAAMLMWGCTADVMNVSQGEVPITLTATVSEGNVNAKTRAGADVQSTQLANGATFTAEFTGGDVIPSSATYTADGEGGATTTPQPRFTLSGTSTTVHAYAPSKPVGTTFSVYANQSTDANYRASDLLYATTSVEKELPAGSLTFAHKMVKVIVNVTLGDGINSIVGVYIIGGSRTVSITDATSCTLGDEQTDALSANSPLTVYSGTHSEGTLSCAALLPPQTVTSSDFLKITTDKGDVIYSLDSKAFATGQSYTFNLTVTAAAVGTTTAITDWNGMQSVNIAPTGDLSIEPISAVIYNGSAQTPALTVMKGETMLTAGTDYDVEWHYNTNAGTAIAVVRGKGAIYQGSVAVAKFTIEKADAEVTTAPTKITGLTYSGSSQSLVTAGVGTGGTLKYKLDDGDWGTSVPSAVNANTSGYSVSYYVEGDANHNSTDPVTISSIAIAKADPTYSVPTIHKSTYYNGGNLQIINSGTCAGGTMSYKLGSDSWTTDATEIVVTSAGNYTVYWKVDGDANHKDVTEASFAVAVTYTLMSSATSSDVGKVICSNGHIHSTVSDVYCGGTASGIIAYVGTAGTADKSSGSGSYKGLALALYNYGGSLTTDGSTLSWFNGNRAACIPNGQSSAVSTAIGTTGDFGKGIDNTNRLATAACGSGHVHAAVQAARNFGVARPSSASQWFMPTLYQWNLMVKAMCGKSADLTIYNNIDYVGDQFNVKITAAGGRGVNNLAFWSSTECSPYNAWRMSFYNGAAVTVPKNITCYMRAVFAF